MSIEPVFTGKIYQKTILTRYGRHIVGSARGYEYDLFIAENKDTKQIEHKLYYVRKAGEWIKSRLVFFQNNKIEKEIRSKSRWC